MLRRQNTKKRFNDESEEECESESLKEEKSDEEEEPATQTREYQSDSDCGEDTEQAVFVGKKKIANEKAKKKVEKKSEVKSEIIVDKSARQTVLLSATLTSAVEKLAGLTMSNPVFVDAARQNLESVSGDLSEINEDLVVPQSVTQSYIVTPPKLRMVTLSAYIAGRCQVYTILLIMCLLLNKINFIYKIIANFFFVLLLQQPGENKMVVFMATQDMIDYHAEILTSILTKPIDPDDEDSDPLVDVEFFKLHGNMTQKERTEVFKAYRLAKSGVLLCTVSLKKNYILLIS